MNEFRTRPLNFPWPPVIYAVAWIIAYAIELKFHSPSRFYIGTAGQIAGWSFIATAIFLDIWAMKTLHDRETTVMPNRSASHLVTCGPYRFTRNPIYLGYTLTTLGVGLILGSIWFGAAAVVAALVTQYLAIRREEFHLLSRFGFEFERYCHATRRWI